MAEIAKGIIDIEINTGSASSELKALQAQINAFNLALNKGNQANSKFASTYSKELQLAINKTGFFTAETIKLQTAASALDKTLSKGKTSLGQFFSAKFNKDSAIAAETMALAAERAKRLQTQFIATSGAANGFQNALAVRPLAAFSSEAAVAAQRSQILSNMLKQGTTQLVNFGKNVQWAGRQLMVGFTIPLTIFGTIAGKTFMDLEKQAVAFKKVYGDIFTTPAELNQNLEAVKGLASEYTKYGIAVKDTIGLAAQAAAAGRQNADLTDAVSQATRLATLGQMDQNAALETTISLQSAFRLSGKDLADTINFLNMVENQTVVSLQDIAVAIPRVAPVIQGLGGDVKDLTVFLAAMQEGGVDAAEGANALKSGLASLINPTKQATEMLNGMGINLETIIQANKGDLMGTVRSFAEALQGLDQFSRQQALEQVFGKFQYAKLGALFENISRKGSQAQQVIATMGYSTEQLGATADKELKTIEESFGVQLIGAMERFKLAIAPIGEIFVKLAIPLVNFATKIAEAFNGLSDGQKKFAAIGAVVVGVVVPAITMLTGLFLNLVGTLTKLGQGISLFGMGFIKGGPVGAIKALTQSSKYLSLAEMDAAMAAQQLSGANEVLNATLIEQVGTANAAAAAIGNLTKAYGSMIATQSAAAGLPSFGVAGAAGKNAANETKTGGIRIRGLRRNLGGGVPGSGNTDTVPAMLTPGEFVVNKEATKNNLELLRAINGGKVNGYNSGGKIPGVQYLSKGDLVKTYVGLIQGGMALYQDVMELPDLDPEVRRQLEEHFNPQQSNTQSSLRTVRTSQLDSALRRTRDGDTFAGGQRGNPTKTTFAHMQRPILGVATRSGDFKGGQPLIFGEDAIKFLEDLYESDKESFSPQQRHYFEAGKLNNFRGWSTHGNLGFDISSYLNAGTNNVQDLITDLNMRRSLGLNPYETMVKSMGLADASEISRVSDEIHEVVTKRLRNLISIGKTTYVDTDLYPHMESAIPRAVRKAVAGTSMDPNMIDELFKPSVKLAAIRARGYTNTDIEELIKEGKLSPEDVIDYESQSHPQKMKKGLALPGFKNLGKLVTISGTSISAINNSPARRRMFDALAQSAMAVMRAKGVRLNLGGNVPGSGNTDTVPAMLTPGEFVVNKKATSQNQQLLEMINGGNVKGYALGGVVSAAGTVASIAGGMSGNNMLMQAGMIAGIAPYILSFGKKILQSSKGVDEVGDASSGVSKGIKNLGPVFKNVATVGGRLSIGMTSMVGGVALAGFAIYKLNKSLDEARKSGAELSEAMYGSSKTVKAMADAFGRETRATTLRRKAVEKAGGQEITEEAVAASGEFMKSEAASQIIKDLELVKKSGEDVSLALRNQLASSIIAGAITTEEAKAIAIDMGKAIGDQGIAVKVAGQLSSLLGPDGKKIRDNVVEITAEISPKIDSQKIKNDAEKAYNELNIAQKFGEVFTGGRESFVEQFSIDKIAEENASALVKEAEARALLNLAYDEGTISLKKYLEQEGKITTGAAIREDIVNNANAVASGYKTYDEMIGKIQDTAKELQNLEGYTTGGSGTLTPGEQAAIENQGASAAERILPGSEEFRKYLEPAKVAFKQELENSGFLPEAAQAMVDGIENNLTQTDVRIFDKFISGQIPQNGYDILIRLQAAGNLTAEDIDRIAKELTAINTIPNVDKILNFNMSDELDLTELYNDYLALEETPDMYKTVNIKDEFSDTLEAFGMKYKELMALPNQEKIVLLRNIQTYETITTAINLEQGRKGGYVDAGMTDQRRTAANALSSAIKAATQPVTGGNTGASGGGSGKENDLLKMLMERFRLREMLIDKEAEGFNKRVKQLNREIELEERQVSLRQKGLDELSKKEDAVNKSYEQRVEALDKVSESNSRMAEQERSRISLASALASGDIAGAASITSEMQQQSAQYQIEDARAALEQQRQRDLESLTVSINGKLMTRQGIESEIETIQNRIYDKGLLVEGLQDKLLTLEDKKLAIAKEREQVETRMYLLEQRKAIQDLTKGKGGKLSKADKEALADYKSAYNQAVEMYNSSNPGAKVQKVNYGGMIAKMANGGIAYKGSTEPPPALRMATAGTVPGTGMTDKVNALLTPGEFVVRKPVADKNRGFLEALNGQIFPGMGGTQGVPTNNFLNGIGSPRYSIPESSVGNIPTSNTSIVSPSSTMYNSTYNVNVNVSGTNASPDDIANVVMAKLSQQNRGNLRSTRY